MKKKEEQNDEEVKDEIFTPIRWRKKDYEKLRNEINKFNRKIKREQKKGLDYLPNTVKYKDIKSRIATRKEFNRQIAKLERFFKKNALNLYTTKAGEKITSWEIKELKKEAEVAKKRYEKELEKSKERKRHQQFSDYQMRNIIC